MLLLLCDVVHGEANIGLAHVEAAVGRSGLFGEEFGGPVGRDLLRRDVSC